VLAAGLALTGSADASPAASTTATGRTVFSVDGGRVSATADPGGASRVVAEPDGGAVLVGAGGTSQSGFYAARLTASGALDPSFGDRGVVHVTVDSPPAVALQVLRQADGKLIVVVSGRQTTAFSFGQLLVVRLDADGSLDQTFGSQGIATVPLAPTCGACATAALAPDGDIVLTGEGGLLSAALGGDPSAPTDWDVASLTPSGALDQSFGDGGLETVPGTDAAGYDVAVLPTGEVMTLGVANLSAGAGSTAMLSLLGPDGGADRNFNGGIPVAVPPGSGATAMLVAATGSVIIGGSTALFAYTPTGQPDPSFGENGVASVGTLPKPLELLPAPGGDVLAIGRLAGAPDTLSAVRVSPSGTIDPTLGGPAGVRVRPLFGGGHASPASSADAATAGPLAQDSFAAHGVAARGDGSYLAVGGVSVVAPSGHGAASSIFDFAAAALTANLTPAPGFGGPARRVRAKLSLEPQTAASADAERAIEIRLDVSAPGLARVTIRALGQVIGERLVAVFGPGPRSVAIGLTPAGERLLRGRSGVAVTATATARDLVTAGTTATVSGTLG
jgi:uncharacterized delta-60 repeat protein